VRFLHILYIYEATGAISVEGEQTASEEVIYAMYVGGESLYSVNNILSTVLSNLYR
jgi:hypothetical protein